MNTKAKSGLNLIIMTMIFAFFLFSGQAIAQERHAASEGDPLSAYIQKNHDSKLVQLFNQNPNDELLARTIRMAMILDNPARFPEFSSSDLEAMKDRYQTASTDFKQITVYMQDGDTYEVAKSRLVRYQNLEPAKNSKNPGTSPSIQVGQ
jgi:hypothetical protein